MISKEHFLENPYKTINAILAGCILLIFIYSAVYSPSKSRHPVPSAHKIITGKDSASTGLSRGFSAIIRLQIEDARKYNIYSLRVFLFFLIQFFVRIVFFFSHQIILEVGNKRFAMIDAIFSTVLFLFLFDPFLAELIKN